MSIRSGIVASVLVLCWSNGTSAAIVTSNLDNPSAAPSALFVGIFSGTDIRLGISFTTDNTTYTLDAINIDATTFTMGADPFAIRLHHDSAGLPGAVVTSFTGPPSPSGVETYLPNSAVTLLPLTTYFVTAEAAGAGLALYGWHPLFANDHAQTGPGTIGDYLVQSFDGGAWMNAGGTNIVRLSIDGTAGPETTPALCLGALVAAFISRHLVRRWTPTKRLG